MVLAFSASTLLYDIFEIRSIYKIVSVTVLGQSASQTCMHHVSCNRTVSILLEDQALTGPAWKSSLAGPFN